MLINYANATFSPLYDLKLEKIFIPLWIGLHSMSDKCWAEENKTSMMSIFKTILQAMNSAESILPKVFPFSS
jgi:hypothetical protein